MSSKQSIINRSRSIYNKMEIVQIHIENETFFVHKRIISSFSPYCKRKFLSEEKEMHIYLKDFKVEAFDDILCHIYSGEPLVIEMGYIKLILEIACFLEIQQVINICIEKYSEELTEELAYHGLLLADEIKCNDLWILCMDFIVGDFKRFTTNSIFFFCFDFAQLKRLLTYNGLINQKEECFYAAMRWINYDERTRVKYLQELTELVVIPLVHTNFFKDVICNYQLIQNHTETQEFLMRVISLQ